MKISTTTFHRNALEAMLRQQERLARTQNQIATGRRLQTAADDPAASVQILELRRALAAADQYRSTAINARNRLLLEEATLADATELLQRVRELALRANSPLLDDATRAMLSVEVRERMRELTAIANRQDANGEYLFAGYAVRTEPFQRSPGGAVQYAGDSGVRAQLIAPGQTVPDGHSGDAVFVRVPQANGTFVTDVAAVNTGNAWIDVGTVIDYAAWVPDNYTIVFTAPDSFEIRDSGNALVASGSYVSGAAIAFRGISVAITGTPASGDRFSVRPAASESLFATLDRLLAALSMPLVKSADRAVLTTKLTASLHQLTQGVDHLLAVRAEVGARVSAIDSADAAREAFQLENQRLLSQLQDVDYAAAVSLMNQQLLALQAAQQSYTRIAQLSLFNYL